MNYLSRGVLAFVCLISGVAVGLAQNTTDSSKTAQKAVQRVAQPIGDTLKLQAATESVPMHNEESIGSKLKGQTLFAVGLQAGLLSGAGLVGRVHLPNRMGAQLAFGIISLGDNTYWDVGGEFQYSFSSGSTDHLYGLAGLGYYYSSTSDTTSGNELERPFRIGFGVGYEWFVSSNLVFNINLPITFFLGGDKAQILPLPQVGLLYYFQ